MIEPTILEMATIKAPVYPKHGEIILLINSSD
jgi:hypothetical protein